MKHFSLLIFFVLGACSSAGVDNLRGYIEYETQSDEYVRWAKEQQITWELFEGEPKNTGLFSCYFGLYYFYDMTDSLRFNATLYIDKQKSWVKPRMEWGGSSHLYGPALKVLKLKFDYYEVVVRQMRKYLIQNRTRFTVEMVKNIPDEYYTKAESEWNQIEETLDFDFSEERLLPLRILIDKKLHELESFDTRVNSRIFNSD